MAQQRDGGLFRGRVQEDGRVQDGFAPQAGSWPAAIALPVGAWGRFHVRDGQAHLDGPLLADAGTARAQIYNLAARRGLQPSHSVAAQQQAATIAADPGFDDPGLDDLSSLPLVTIDEPHSRDLDQALYVERAGDGFRVWYAIADPAWSVRPGTPLFDEALERGSTFYLPGLTLPMLPAVLSEGVISLNPQVDRRAMVFEVVLDRVGEVVESKIRAARVRSRVKTDYDTVQAFLDGEDGVPGGADAQVAESLHCLREVGTLRMARAAARDVVRLRRREISVRIADDDGYRFVARTDPRNDVERYNEQISLLCNVEGARFLRRHTAPDAPVQPIYRTHAPPDAFKVRSLARQLRSLVRRHALPEQPWQWRPGRQSLADYLARLPQRGPHQRVAQAIHRQVMRIGGRSGFDAEPSGHHGVGAEVYARFTAPMREIVGVFVHKEAWERLGHLSPQPAHDDESLRERVMEASNRARQSQRVLDREANRLVLDQLFGDDLRADQDQRVVRRGTVMGISRDKVHVQLDEPPIDVKVYRAHIGQQRGERVRLGRDGVTLRDEDDHAVFTTGTAVDVQVAGRDDERDRWILALDDAPDRS